MNNLGMYGVVTTEAGKVGGMEEYLAKLADIAVKEAAPGIAAKGVLVGVGVAIAGGLGLIRLRKYFIERRNDIEKKPGIINEIKRRLENNTSPENTSPDDFDGEDAASI